ncbi:putative GDSL-like Lipase/Acylhydrolase family protein [Hibiscus syriacus]|uniref:Exocyst subunit Exo70 family protein n=1 Tax=Hibiscus syriacus TaxID=106335 RepID=A0A6A2ZBG0_HIBSY|nr:putative GDSL-like Lipase/Acylhydrolase family protein [Hibiscus syriacus]
MAGNGEEKLLAVARHIAKTLGQNDTMADDILQIFSNFDGRFSREKLSDKMVDENNPRGCAALERALHSLDRQISQYVALNQPIWAHTADSSAFLDAIDDLIRTIRDWSPMAAEKSVGACLVRADDLMQQAMFRVEDEFRSLMDRGAESFELSWNNIESTGNLSFDSDEDNDEHEEGLLHNGAGLDHQIPVAQPIPNSRMYVKKQSSWVVFDQQLREELRISVSRLLLPAYRNFTGRLQRFLRSGGTLVGLIGSIQRISRLGLTSCLRGPTDHLVAGSSQPQGSFVLNEAITIWKRLGESIRGIFMELENLIRRDPAKAAVPGGGLHPITRYIDDRRASLSSMSVQMAWIMELLESNLEMKSKIYSDSALCSVYMMNNGRYVIQKVKDSELGSLLGDDWIRKHTAKVRQYCTNYQRISWNKILGTLKPDESSLASNAIVKSMKEKVKSFNSQFEDVCKKQSSWVVFDQQLREELRISVSRLLLPAYRNFTGRLQSVPEIGRNAGRLNRYDPEDIEARINKLFEGANGSSGGRK